jgi:ATP-binding cassette, subfamily B, bacterial MsbA
MILDFILGSEIAFYIRRHRAMVFLALALTAVSSIFVVIPAYLLQPFVDEGMRSGSAPVTWKIPWVVFTSDSWMSWERTERVLVEGISPNALLLLLTLIAFVSILVRSVTEYFGTLSATAFSNRAVRSLRIDLFRKFVALPLGFYHTRRSGELVGRATADLTVMQSNISTVIIGLIQHPLTAAVFLIYLLMMNYQLTLVIFLIVPAIVVVVRLFGRKVKKHAVRVQDATAEVTSSYHETLLCMKVIQGCYQGESAVKGFSLLANRLYSKVMHWNRWKLGLGPMMDVTSFLILPAVLIAGKVYFNHSLGELMSMIYAFSRVYGPTKKLAQVNNSLRTLQGATERVFSIMKTVPAIEDRPGAKVLPRHRESIEFENVSFGYHEEPVLSGISFRVTAGEMIAFVGSTGAGKSTLLDLVPRFYDVTEGRILIDGFDIREVTLESLRRQIGVVGQEILLFHDTIANNIRYGNPEKSLRGGGGRGPGRTRPRLHHGPAPGV